MKDITGLIGREPLVEKALQEVRKGRHVVLTGQVGVGKSAVLAAVLERLERRRGERRVIDAESDELPDEAEAREEQRRYGDQRTRRTRTVIPIGDHQPKAQFVCIARRLLAEVSGPATARRGADRRDAVRDAGSLSGADAEAI